MCTARLELTLQLLEIHHSCTPDPKNLQFTEAWTIYRGRKTSPSLSFIQLVEERGKRLSLYPGGAGQEEQLRLSLQPRRSSSGPGWRTVLTATLSLDNFTKPLVQPPATSSPLPPKNNYSFPTPTQKQLPPTPTHPKTSLRTPHPPKDSSENIHKQKICFKYAYFFLAIVN